MMSAFFPSDPQDKLRANAEANDWKVAARKRAEWEKRENRRFVVTAALSAVAALAAVAGVILQLAAMR
jgi:hypothetical protein